MAESSFSAQEYKKFQNFLEKACGISLGENKHYLVESRLRKLMTAAGHGTLNDLVDDLESGRSGRLREQIIEAMTTNETLWFRDAYPFNLLAEKIFPELAERRINPVRIWTAACSSGQEPYSISMVADEFNTKYPGQLPNVHITATDISPAIIRDAVNGMYDKAAIARGMSDERRKRFFHSVDNDQYWQINDEVKKRVSFSQHNLLQSYNLLGKFDIVFCRNVLIYFSSEGKRDILSRIARVLNPGGYLVLGASESISGLSDAYNMIHSRPGVLYQLK